jgi:hypothetical protein
MGLRAVTEDLKAGLIHLRLHFSVVLLPLFLWGFLLTGRRPTSAFGLGLLIVHVFLYGGANAFNSYFDRDEGPIGGLYRPPPVSGGTLAVALFCKAAGLLLSLCLGWAFVGVYLAFVVLSVLYSHPRTRWKARPIRSVLTVAVGQGGLGFLAGWLCGRSLGEALTTGRAWIGMAYLFNVSDGLRQWPDPGVASRGFSPPESPPPFARGPSPAATAAKPIPPPADTRLPPALTEVPRRTATRRPNGPDARTRRFVRRNVGGLPANSVPFHPPPTPRGRPALSILHSGALHPPKGLPSSVAGCVYGVGQSVDSGRHALFRATP